MFDTHDTIAAPATASGGAVAMIRISGPEAIAVCDRIFRGSARLADTPAYTVRFGRITDGDRTVDEVLATVFRAPRSYTGEDSVELSCHGSSYVVAEILRLLHAAGARTAEPGEFTARAFLAGKMDLAQAEAVADLIASSSRASHALATAQMRGGFSDDLHALRDRLLHLASLLELELDFSEEDVEFADRTQLRGVMEEIGAELDTLCRSFSLGNALKQGVGVAIVGAPNAGKSTLLNRLLGEERAMVSDIAGTTRDAIEETLDIDGVLFRFIDTAGLRRTDDRLERMGIERTLAAAARARIILRVTDAADDAAASPPLLPPLRDDQRLIEAINKIDRCSRLTLPAGALGISARDGIGIDALRRALRDAVDTEALYHGDTVVSTARHYDALASARAALDRALAALCAGRPADLLSEELRHVLHHLGTITGEITTDEILSNIFSKFCIGK
ncbi:tRNA uridine-5-carboxymethylaminomethyl(34) synthesis GTPase MnmE [uncultured Alistipes sp.]|uniref:tRNA uridine-5-carboxymethylaminomethyl(34) synthesis GTPase MnmE n=1 Tax=uncultured Alistipes sp. TaxID=538949 RepID=UPI00260B3B81|nr:tRNA uridine-5-carboxymethylaminomethyl(34) synthesis GTPase MnmE [uncultured Alistipes sp.]